MRQLRAGGEEEEQRMKRLLGKLNRWRHIHGVFSGGRGQAGWWLWIGPVLVMGVYAGWVGNSRTIITVSWGPS